ncbi:hypothetical protein [Trinickia mobilis]|uniref:hypothetical protein n=1 Tax=Trinickia mobilis TaxID=2816356 RepID=UPI001A8D5BA5|nr:hypothetical protein [Trinickia mobilis]
MIKEIIDESIRGRNHHHPAHAGTKAAVDKLPLTEGGFMTFEPTPVDPLAPLALLIQK